MTSTELLVGAQMSRAIGGMFSEMLTSQLQARYGMLSRSGRLFSAYATITAPVIFSTAAGTGGPLLWNEPQSDVDAVLLAVGLATSVVTTVATGLGITGAGGQSLVPATTTAIDASGPCLIGGPAAKVKSYRIGTPTNAGAQFTPFAQVHTGALTADTTGLEFIFLDGLWTVPPGTWASVAAGATATTLQAQMALVWAEMPRNKALTV